MIFIILLIVVAVIYFVAFAALNKFKNGAEGAAPSTSHFYESICLFFGNFTDFVRIGYYPPSRVLGGDPESLRRGHHVCEVQGDGSLWPRGLLHRFIKSFPTTPNIMLFLIDSLYDRTLNYSLNRAVALHLQMLA